jgi:serine/threonine protein kinase
VVNNEEYGKAADSWSLGLIAYELLSGEPMFGGKSNQQTKREILDCNWGFDSEIWEEIGWEAKDFIEKTVLKDPTKRLRSERLMAHPWFVKYI